jgi:hypothetical protein
MRRLEKLGHPLFVPSYFEGLHKARQPHTTHTKQHMTLVNRNLILNLKNIEIDIECESKYICTALVWLRYLVTVVRVDSLRHHLDVYHLSCITFRKRNNCFRGRKRRMWHSKWKYIHYYLIVISAQPANFVGTV